MSEEREDGSPPLVWASDVANHPFAAAKRGYDPDEVRSYLVLVAEVLAAAEQRQDELRRELESAEMRLRHPDIDEATLTAALGQRSAAVLRNAHEEAARIGQLAESSTASLLREAHQKAAEARVQAEAAAAERIAEAEILSNSFQQQAKADSDQIIDAARAEGERAVQEGRAHGQAMVDQAQEARRRVLADMAQRRRAMSSQIDQFRAARDELAAAVLGVRHSVDRIVEGLGHAEQSARAAAQAAPRLPAEETAALLVAEGEQAAAEVGVLTGAEANSATVPAVAPAAVPPPAGVVPPAAAPGASELSIDDIRTAVPPHPEHPAEPGPPGQTPVQTPGQTPVQTPVPADAANEPVRNSERVGSGEIERPSQSEGATDGGAGTTDVDDAAPDPVQADDTVPGSALTDDKAPGPDPTDDTVEGLFARLRASRQAEAMRSTETAGNGNGETAPADGGGRGGRPEQAGAHPPAGEPAPDEERSSAAGPGAGVVADGAEERGVGTGNRGAVEDGAVEDGAVEDGAVEVAIARRAELLDPITTVLARRIKRALQDDQNRMLERMRSAAGGWSDDLLPDEQEQRLQYAEAALPEIRQAIAGGIAYSRASLPKSRGRAPVPDDRLVRDVADELAGTLVAALRHRLGGDTDHEAVERVGAAYREWRGERVERLVGDCAVEAFSAGVLAATPGGTALRWARNEASLGCADCEDNVLGGAVDRGREFPTGHRYPPAHPGCRCLVLPTPA